MTTTDHDPIPFATREITRTETALHHAYSTVSALQKALEEAETDRLRELEGLYPDVLFPCGRSHACLCCSPNRVLPGPGCTNCRGTGYNQTPCRGCIDARQDAPVCPTCKGRGKVPDWGNWNSEHGEPRPRPCPDCQTTAAASPTRPPAAKDRP